MFCHLNKLDTSLQRFSTNIFVLKNKTDAFKKKPARWDSFVQKEIELFTTLNDFLTNVDVAIELLYIISMGVRRNFSREGGNVDILLILYRLLTTQCKWTFAKRFIFSTPQRK